MDYGHADSSAAAGWDYSSAAAGGEYNHSYGEEGQQDHGNQRSGGEGGGSTEYAVEATVEGEPSAPQQGAYPPQQHHAYKAAYNPSAGYNVTYHSPNKANPAPPNHPPGPVYPPNASPAPFQAQAPPPQFQYQAPVAPIRPPPTKFVASDHAMPFQQAMIRPEIGPPVPWTSDLFGCLQDCYGCPLVIIAPCVTFGQIAEIVDTGYNRCQTAGIIYALAFFLGIPCLYSYTYRTKMRLRFNLREDPLDDLCTHFWCEWCALAQEYRELRYRGIDPALGYDLQRDCINRAMEAPVPPRMSSMPPHMHAPQQMTK